MIEKLCKEFNIDFYYFTEKPKLKLINKDNSVGYNIAEIQNVTIHDKLIEQYEERIKELKSTIEYLKKLQNSID